jgi:hypothetical protein
LGIEKSLKRDAKKIILKYNKNVNFIGHSWTERRKN